MPELLICNLSEKTLLSAVEGETGAAFFPFLIMSVCSFLLPALSLRSNTEILSKSITNE